MNCPKWGYYCNGQRIEVEGTKQQDWRACARSCKNNSACNYWHFYMRDEKDGNPIFPNKCFLYTNCENLKGKLAYQQDKCTPAIQNVAGNRNCTSETGPSKLSFNINCVYIDNFLIY